MVAEDGAKDGSHGRFDFGAPKVANKPEVAEIELPALLAAAGTVIVHLSTLKSCHSLRKVRTNLHLTNNGRTVPTAVRKILINQAIINGHRGSVISVE